MKNSRPITFLIEGSEKPKLVASTGMEIKFKTQNALADFVRMNGLGCRVNNLSSLPVNCLHRAAQYERRGR